MVVLGMFVLGTVGVSLKDLRGILTNAKNIFYCIMRKRFNEQYTVSKIDNDNVQYSNLIKNFLLENVYFLLGPLTVTDNFVNYRYIFFSK
jgi:hypothetical protein